MTLVKALMTYLKLEGETLPDFAAQIKRLTPEDKAWFRAQFAAQNISII